MQHIFRFSTTRVQAEGTTPETAYKGSLNVRLGSDLHKRAAVYAMTHQQSLNSFIEEAVRDKLSATSA
ncbi:MAG: toxin-antitoxin system HicB family antitoxin [Oscillospiraceae bacterium]|nr:toxin-antitoxin system HicB family antitoxin [Oscillospiraceae bacterium]